MPRPEPRKVTFEIDGRDVTAPAGSMLVDGAKYGDVEIPYFCYEPKLGKPVGACRMCLVEIEGMPKLQTACSTEIKDGMVVTTKSDQVRHAQEAVVEFLLINHPLDCPVCDKGGECPLQDISYGWGAGRSRYIEPKRHFKKPIELSPLVAIDRERCILCYRCVRFSQEVSEDYQLVFVERGDHTFVGTHRGEPYVAPFSGNIIELCPVGALTSIPYRFRARPWDVEDAGSICTFCPSQCNVTFTVRDDDRVVRVLARDNEEVDDGWLCDRGRFGYQAVHSPDRIIEPMVRDGGALRGVSWERALSAATAGLGKAGQRTGAIAGGETTNEEGFLLQQLMREGLGSPHLDSRTGGALDPDQARVLARPGLSVPVSDIDYAGTVLVLEADLTDAAPIIDLRVRKAARRNNVKVAVASSRPGTLDPNADAVLRFAPGGAEAVLGALATALGYGREGAEASPGDSSATERWGLGDLGRGEGPGPDERARRAGATEEAVGELAGLLRSSGPVVILWDERLSHGDRGRQTVAGLLALARALDLAGSEGAGLIEVPAGTNGRGLREVGCLPNLRPGLADAEPSGKPATEIAAAMGGELSALILMHADPLRTHPGRAAWEGALEAAGFVVAFADFPTDSIRDHADVVFPAEAYAEKDGTMTHPDGRLQRLRQGIARPKGVRPEWSVLLELIGRVSGSQPELLTAAMVFAEMTKAVPFYSGLTLDEIGGRGVRWQDRDAASGVPDAALPEEPLEAPPEPVEGMRLRTAPSIWSGRETERAPVLSFLAPRQQAELSPDDARRLGIAPGDEVVVAANGASVRATAALRDGLPPGSVVLIEGTREHNATALTNGGVPVVEVRRA